jgi:Holliday junction resolvase
MTEQDLYNFVRELGYEDLIMAQNPYSTWDCYSIGSNIYVELKCRRTHYDKLLIEKSKFDRLTKAAKKKGMVPVYICSTPQGVWAFNLAGAELEWANEEMPTTTDFEDTSKKIKKVSYLDTKEGLQLT